MRGACIYVVPDLFEKIQLCQTKFLKKESGLDGRFSWLDILKEIRVLSLEEFAMTGASGRRFSLTEGNLLDRQFTLGTFDDKVVHSGLD